MFFSQRFKNQTSVYTFFYLTTFLGPALLFWNSGLFSGWDVLNLFLNCKIIFFKGLVNVCNFYSLASYLFKLSFLLFQREIVDGACLLPYTCPLCCDNGQPSFTMLFLSPAGFITTSKCFNDVRTVPLLFWFNPGNAATFPW